MTSSELLQNQQCVEQQGSLNPTVNIQKSQILTENPIQRGEAMFYRFLKKLEASRNYDRSLLKPIALKKSEHTSVTTRCALNEAEDLLEIKRVSNTDLNANNRPKSIDNLSFSNTDGVKNSNNFAQFEALTREERWVKGRQVTSQRTTEISSDRLIQSSDVSAPIADLQSKLPFHPIASETSNPSQIKKGNFQQPKSNIHTSYPKVRSKSLKCLRLPKVSRKRSYAQPQKKIPLPELDRQQISKASNVSPDCLNNSLEMEQILSDDENKINFGNFIQIAQSTKEDGLIEEDEGRVETIVFRKRNEEEGEEDEGEPSGPMMLVASGLSAVAVTGFFVLKGLKRMLW